MHISKNATTHSLLPLDLPSSERRLLRSCRKYNGISTRGRRRPLVETHTWPLPLLQQLFSGFRMQRNLATIFFDVSKFVQFANRRSRGALSQDLCCNARHLPVALMFLEAVSVITGALALILMRQTNFNCVFIAATPLFK